MILMSFDTIFLKITFKLSNSSVLKAEVENKTLFI